MPDDLSRFVAPIEREDWARYLGPAGELRRRGDRRRQVRRHTAIAGSAVAVVGVMLGGLVVTVLRPGEQAEKDVRPAAAGRCGPPAHEAATAGSAGAHPGVMRGAALPASVALAASDLGAGWQRVRATTGQPARVPEGVYFLPTDAVALSDRLLRAQEQVRFAELRTDETRQPRHIETRVARYGQNLAGEAFNTLVRDATCRLEGHPAPRPVASGKGAGAEWIAVQYQPPPRDAKYLEADIVRATAGWRVVARAGDLVARADIRPIVGDPAPDPLLTRQWVSAIGAAVAARLTGQPPGPVPAVPKLRSDHANPPRGFLQADDLGTGWRVGDFPGDRQELTHAELTGRPCRATRMPLARTGHSQWYRGKTPQGHEWIVIEQVLPMRPGDAERVLAAARASVSTGCAGEPDKIVAAGPDVAGDDAVVLAFRSGDGFQMVWIRSGNTVIRLDVLPGGAAGGVPLPGGTNWTTGVAKKAAQRAAVLD